MEGLTNCPQILITSRDCPTVRFNLWILIRWCDTGPASEAAARFCLAVAANTHSGQEGTMKPTREQVMRSWQSLWPAGPRARKQREGEAIRLLHGKSTAALFTRVANTEHRQSIYRLRCVCERGFSDSFSFGTERVSPLLATDQWDTEQERTVGLIKMVLVFFRARGTGSLVA